MQLIERFLFNFYLVENNIRYRAKLKFFIFCKFFAYFSNGLCDLYVLFELGTLTR